MEDAKPFSTRGTAKKETEQRAKRELRERRERQLVEMQSAAESLQRRMQSTRSMAKRCEALLSHSGGFYDEVNKLAKGKALLEVTPLALERSNEIIRDAKTIVEGDVYLDRTKEFVPAGNNPVYPDVLVNVRAVRDSLQRFKKEAANRLKDLSTKLKRARTAVGALEYFLDDDAEGDEHEKNLPSREAVECYTEGFVSDSCFFRDSASSERFDLETLDGQPAQEYIPMSEEDDSAESESSADHEGRDDTTDGPGSPAEIGDAGDDDKDNDL